MPDRPPGGQGRDPGRRSGHPVPAGHEGRAQGTAAGRRPAGAAVHRRGGRRGRHQRRPAGHRPGQDLDGRPLRPPARPGGPAGGEGRPRAAGRGPPAPASWPTSTPAGRASRSASATRSAYAESHVGDEPFAVLLGDEFVDEAEPLLPAMLDLQARTGGIVLAFIEVAAGGDQPVRHRLGRSRPSCGDDDVVEVTGLVEKPSPEDAPSNLAVLGRYILPADDLRGDPATPSPGSGGEIQLTDAMAALLDEGTPVHGIVYRGHRYDTGMPLGYLQAVVQLAVPARRPRRRSSGDWLGEFVDRRMPAADDRDGRCRGGRQRADAARRLPGQRAAQAAGAAAARPRPHPGVRQRARRGRASRRTRSRPSTRPRSTGTRPAGRTSRGRPDRLAPVVRHVRGRAAAGAAQRRRRPRRGELAAGAADPRHLLLGGGRCAAAGRRRRRRAGGLDRPGHGRGGDLPRPQARLRRCAGPATSCPPAQVLARAGTYVTPALVAVFAATGIGHVVVRPSPRVVVVATGDELVDVGRASQPGQVVDANSHALTAAAAEAGALAYRVGICDDDPEGLRGAAGGPDAAGRPDHHHRRHRHRPRRHGAPGPVPPRRRPRRRRVHRRRALPRHRARLRHGRRRGGAGGLPARRARAPP